MKRQPGGIREASVREFRPPRAGHQGDEAPPPGPPTLFSVFHFRETRVRIPTHHPERTLEERKSPWRETVRGILDPPLRPSMLDARS